MSSAAKKAWATRRKFNPKKWRKKKPKGLRTTDSMIHILKNGKILGPMKTSETRNHTPCTVIPNTWEAEQIKQYGPKWYRNPQVRKKIADDWKEIIERTKR